MGDLDSSKESTSGMPANFDLQATVKDDAEPSPEHSTINRVDMQEESLEEILLQELLQKTTELQQATTKLVTLKKEIGIIRHIVASHANGSVFLSPAGDILFANSVFCGMTGIDFQGLKNKSLDEFILLPEPEEALSIVLNKTEGAELWQGTALLKGDNENHLPLTLSINYCKKNVRNDVPGGFVCQFSPAEGTAPESSANGMPVPASLDSLTGLPDRSAFHQHLSICVNEARKNRSMVGLLYVDLDNFKRINRMLGPAFGDEILCMVTLLLQQTANAVGINFIARLSSDEFAIILPPPCSQEQTDTMGQRILENFRRPFSIKSRDIFITPSIGVTLYPDDGDNPPELLRNADTAMEIVKAKGGNNICRWENSLDAQAVENLHLENDLRKAVSNREIFNYYQPQIDLTNGKIIGMEALARWDHPEHGFVSPVVFIPLAVNAGLIDDLGLALVRQACEDGKDWLKLGFRDFTMAVNLSGRMLRRLDLFDQIIDCLDSTGFPPDYLEVEFTESVLIENMDNTIDLINKCRAMGIKMAIDDFGTGYSSLSYLQRFSVDKIKIDRSFITDVTTNPGDAAITMAIIAIAKKLNFEVLAEGVETEEQLFFLQENQCDFCQGFLFSKPIPAARMLNLLMRDASVALQHRRIIDKFYSIKAHEI
jgi:diguanylate cyclase (GGDEF)-like protein